MTAFRKDRLDLLAVQGTLKSLLQHHSSKASFFRAKLSFLSKSHIHAWSIHCTSGLSVDHYYEYCHELGTRHDYHQAGYNTVPALKDAKDQAKYISIQHHLKKRALHGFPWGKLKAKA